MFCSKCGKEIADDAKFCAHCGTSVSGGGAPAAKKQVVESKDPVLVIRPKFILILALLSNLYVLFYIPFVLIFFGVAIADGSPIMFFIGLGILAVFSVMSFIPVIIKKITYGKTTYRFYNTRLDYFEGFWTIEEKAIEYRKITEAHLRKGFIQKMFGLGTITLSTPATGTQYGMAVSGINLKDLPNPDEVYKKVKALINKEL